MKVKLQIVKQDKVLFAGTYDIVDAESFGRACTDVWTQLRQQQFDKETSIGALMEHLENNVLDRLSGAQITVESA
jgi:hypothetical protein